MNSENIATHFKRVALTLAALLCLALGAQAQEVVRLTGRVVSKQTGEPLIGVNITDTRLRRALAVTDEDGRFSMNTHVGTQLRFSMIGAKQEMVKVKNDKFLTVKLDEDDVQLKEVEVKTKRITDRIMPEPTDIEVKGNWLYVRTRVRVPKQMFQHDRRLVVQPILNNVTENKLTLMRPMVYDAKEYHRTQDRLYNFNMNSETAGDPLAKHVTVKSSATREKGQANDIIGYSDSIFVKNLKAEYSCDVYMAIEDYTHIIYRDTTIIARGTVNPLRWLDCSLLGKPLTDASYYPTPEKQMRDSKGNINLKFLIGKATLNTNDPHNDIEIEKLRQQIDAIRADKDATIQSLSLEGIASPDGRYNFNQNLARQRMDFALGYIREKLPENLRSGIEFSSKSSVAPWSEVVALLRRDSLFSEADQVQSIINRSSNIDVQSARIRRLPFFRSVLEARYLPKLRQVNYVMNYTIFRQLTLDEIRNLYAADYKKLTRYEFFTLYRSENDAVKRDTIIRQALEMYPSFMIAANDLAADLINRGESDPQLLEPFAGEKAPATVNINHAIALLQNRQFAAADECLSYVPKTEESELLHAISGVLNGRYDENYKTVAATGKRNELLMMLAMKRNKEALKLSRELPDDEALTHYLRAICLNRTDDAVGAYEELKRSFEMDPSLEKIAHTDGDVNDLLLEQKK